MVEVKHRVEHAYKAPNHVQPTRASTNSEPGEVPAPRAAPRCDSSLTSRRRWGSGSTRSSTASRRRNGAGCWRGGETPWGSGKTGDGKVPGRWWRFAVRVEGHRGEEGLGFRGVGRAGTVGARRGGFMTRVNERLDETVEHPSLRSLTRQPTNHTLHRVVRTKRDWLIDDVASTVNL